MDQHPIPRQITTFEFKLIGFMTLRQFIYLVIFIPIGVIVYFLFPIPALNIVLGILTGVVGLFFAFVPINDRPLDVWIKNLLKRLTKPTQYLYFKNNPPIYYLENLFFISDPHITASHVESQEKLSAYLTSANKNAKKTEPNVKKKQTLQTLFQKPFTKKLPQTVSPQPVVSSQSTKKTPFLTGLVKNHKLIPLQGILIYVKGGDNKQTLRLLKTNPHGIFATFNPLDAGEYFFDFKDPNNNYFFDTMKIKIDSANQKPIEIFSKELL